MSLVIIDLPLAEEITLKNGMAKHYKARSLQPSEDRDYKLYNSHWILDPERPHNWYQRCCDNRGQNSHWDTNSEVIRKPVSPRPHNH